MHELPLLVERPGTAENKADLTTKAQTNLSPCVCGFLGTQQKGLEFIGDFLGAISVVSVQQTDNFLFA